MNKNRYHRQIIIPEISKIGQEMLSTSQVLIVGAGGLGSPAAIYLAAAGVGTLGILDKDIIDVSNLQRQILHNSNCIGMTKVDSAKKTLNVLNPEVDIIKYHQELNEENVKDIIKNYDVVVAAVDNTNTRYILNKACIELNIPLVEGGIYNWDGVVHTIIRGKGPCFECMYPKEDNGYSVYKVNNDTNEPQGVIGAVAGIVGSCQALEVIKILVGAGKLLTKKMLFIDGLKSEITELKVNNNDECPICGIKG